MDGYETQHAEDLPNWWSPHRFCLLNMVKLQFAVLVFNFLHCPQKLERVDLFDAWWLKRRGLAQGCDFFGYNDYGFWLEVTSFANSPVSDAGMVFSCSKTFQCVPATNHLTHITYVSQLQVATGRIKVDENFETQTSAVQIQQKQHQNLTERAAFFIAELIHSYTQFTAE